MKKILALLMSICMIAFLAGCGNDNGKTADSEKPSTSEKITVQAAASLKGALTELADTYKKDRHLADDQIAVNFAGSGTLRQQIEQGAPASLFISADEKNMKMLQEKDLVTDVKPFVTNELVLVVPKGQPQISLDQITTVKRIVLGTPETVPAGNYGKQVLTKMGVWEQVEPNVVYAKDVKSVTASISRGAGDAGFIYKTDAIAAGDAVQIAAVTPVDSHDPVIYPIGIIKKYDNALAKDFYQYVMSDEGKKILEKYGFYTGK
ncbi:molybdate ABC transporter substrate-binding protein [Veillonella rodentium]|uniref:Molybdate-binding periplasmic protein n=1 Tax=Veillonella rodentium TaxID=248315 RepID=A0A239YGF2_9FIRM|nr:molybdate ABC transporter substrate-binding protein [Veillonella rodentium]SNV57927.1 Molybdate-binding periplasmic protein precursor [Veillonella rodentium]